MWFKAGTQQPLQRYFAQEKKMETGSGGQTPKERKQEPERDRSIACIFSSFNYSLLITSRREDEEGGAGAMRETVGQIKGCSYCKA